MSATITAEQFDLISDDPRVESPPGMVAEFAAFYRASKEHGGLLTQGQAAKVLDVPTGQISSWITRGRLSVVKVVDLRMVSAAEVLALYREREKEIRHSGGRGMKAPSLAELAEGALRDCFGSR